MRVDNCSLSAPLRICGRGGLYESDATPGHMLLAAETDTKLSPDAPQPFLPPVPAVELWIYILDKYRFDLWRVSNGVAQLLILQ